MPRPLVSVITPTWARHGLLAGAVDNVRAQTYRPIEHVIVSDGPDHDLEDWLIDSESAYADSHLSGEIAFVRNVPIRFVELGRNWSSYLPNSFCAAPLTVAMLLARGDLMTFLSDDERATPDHISSLVDLLEATGADFAYGKVRMHLPGQRPEDGYTIGCDPPQLGQITNALFRADILKLGLYPFGAGMTSDWACISNWQSRGARHAFFDRVTLTHQQDH